MTGTNPLGTVAGKAPVRTAGSPGGLRKEAQDLLNQAYGLAKAAGREDLTTELLATANPEYWARTEAALVIVGETNRGKSSLINALLDLPALLPTDPEVTTNVHTIIRWADAPTAWVLLDPDDSDDVPAVRQQIPIEDVSLWSSAKGNPSNAKGVQAVEIGVDHPLLRAGMTIVDTPGVGGLDGAHTRMTEAALTHGDAILFVTEGVAPILQPELEFLSRVGNRIDAVIIALTKVDVYSGWETILRDDQELLASHATRLKDAPIIPVSSVWALEAAEARARGEAEWADQLRESSGFPRLHAAITSRVAGRMELLRLANVVQVSRSAVDSLAARDEAFVRAAEQDPELLPRLQAEEERLDSFLSDQAQWARELVNGFDDLTFQVQEDFDRAISDLEERYGAKIAAWAPGTKDRIGEELVADLRAVGVGLQALLRERAEALVAEAAGELGLQLTMDREQLPTDSDRLEVTTTGAAQFADPLTSVRAHYQNLSLGSGLGQVANSGFTALLGTAVMSLPGLSFGLGIIGLVAGQIIGAKPRDQARAMELVNRTIARARSPIQREVARRIRPVRRAAEEAFKAALQKRKDELQTAVAESRALLQQSEEVRAREAAAAEERAGRLHEAGSAADLLLQKIQAEVAR